MFRLQNAGGAPPELPGLTLEPLEAERSVAKVDLLLSDPTKAQTQLGWHRDVNFEQLVLRMVDADLAAVNGKQSPLRLAS